MMGSSELAEPASESPESVDYQSFTAGSADVNTVATADGIYRYVSSASLRLFGWIPAALEGRRLEEFVHPDDIQAVHAVNKQLTSGKVATATWRFLCRDGSYR